MKKKIVAKFFNLVVSLLLVGQTLAPALPLLAISAPVYAQEATDPSPEASPTTQQEASPTPEIQSSPEPDTSPSPTEEPSPLPSQEQASPSPTTETPSGDNGNTSQTDQATPNTSDTSSNNQSPSPPPPTTTVETSVSQENQPELNEQVEVTLVNAGAVIPADLLILDAPESEASATLSTDKPDYAPTDEAIITGSGFASETSYTLVVRSDGPPPVYFETSITTNSEGSFSYTYQLDGTYRPLYIVEVKDETGNVVAVTTFTDSPTKITAKTHQGQKSDLTYTSGNVTQYEEGDFINFRFETEATHGPTSGQLEVRFAGDDGTCLFFDNYFNLGSTESISGGPVPTVSILSGPTAADFGTSNGEWVVTLNINYTGTFDHPPGSARINYTLQLSDEAGQCNGSSQHSSLALGSTPGDVANPGQQNVPVPANQVIELPEIIVIKNIDRDGNGSFEDTADAGEYCFSLDSGSCIPTDGSGQVVFVNVTPDGAHTITETQLDFSQGTYSFVSGSGTNCTFIGSTATATVQSGPTATDASCTFNNGLVQGTLRVIKNVINDNGGNATASDFSLHVKSGGVDVAGSPAAGSSTGVIYTLNAGTYVVSEDSPPSGYTQAGFSDDCDSGGSVTVVAGVEKTCTITNDDQQAFIIVDKTVINDNGGSAAADDFLLTVDGSPALDEVAVPVNSGAHTAGETNLPGYTAGAFGTDCDENGNVTLLPGETKTCTITNSDNEPSLTLIKEVIIDNGGTATESDWTLEATGPTGFSGAGPSVSNDPSFDIGTYDLSESGPSGYTASTYSCVKNDGAPVVANSITLGLGDTATCTITNDDIAPTLKLVKLVTKDDGGTAVAGDWTLTATGDEGFSDSGDSITFHTVKAGVGYVLSESVVAGYDAGNWSCNGGNLVGNTVTLALDDDVTCTITNNDQPGEIHGQKFEDHDGDGVKDGGDQGLLGWTIFLDTNNNGVLDGGETSTTTNGSGNYSFTGLSAATYKVREVVKPGWTQTTANPSDIVLANGQVVNGIDFGNFELGSVSGKKFEDLDGDGAAHETGEPFLSGWTIRLYNIATTPWTLVGTDVTDSNGEYGFTNLEPGSYRACEVLQSGWTQLFPNIANNNNSPSSSEEGPRCQTVNIDTSGESNTRNFGNFKLGSITIEKITFGGDDTFTYAVIPTEETFQIQTLGNTGDKVLGDLPAGEYVVTEQSLSGWDLTDLTCSAGGTADINNRLVTITITSGQDVTCTFTNSRLPQLTVTKFVDNEDGGTNQVSDFPLFVDGNGVTSGVTNTYQPDNYLVTETGDPGYSATFGGNCDEQGNVNLAYGDDKTCTITNDDIAPTLKLVKEVVTDNGGTAVADDWTLSADAESPDDDRNFDNLGGSGSFETVYANVEYDLSESAVSGYSASSWNCDGDILDGSTVTLGLNEDVTCTITNDDQTGRLVVVKVLINDDGGDKVFEDFSYTVNGGSSTPFESDGQNEESVDSGNYTIVEDPESGYETTYDNCDSVFVPNGGSATCTITNDDIAPTLKLVKEVTNDDGGTAASGEWTLRARKLCAVGDTNPDCGFEDQGDSTTFYPLLAGVAYTLFESGPTDYTAGSWSCEGGNLNGNKLTLGLDEEVTCTITNDDIAPTLKLVKEVEGGSSTPSEWTLRARTLCAVGNTDPACGFSDSGDSTTFHPLAAGKSYRLLESGPSGYTAGNWSCDNTGVQGNVIVLGLNQETTCTITNTRDTGTIEVIKEIESISEDSGLFDLQIDGTTEFSDASDGDTTGSVIVLTGTHSVGEIAGTGTDLNDYVSNISCSNDDSTEGTLLEDIEVSSGDEITCTITNTRKGNVIVTKYNDENGDGEISEGEGVLGDWDINLTSGEDYDETETTDDTNGDVEFNNLVPGSYTLSETIKNGWEQTNIFCPEVETSRQENPEEIGVFVGAGQTVNCSILNRSIVPILTITKTNNATGDQGPGGDVTYTITVTVEDNDIDDVTVTDLLPGGFTYRPGSATINGVPAVPEPVYASPGVWTLGDLLKDDVVVLTLIADIGGSQQPGLYKDIAWAQGTAADSSTVLALAVDPGDLDPGDSNFVGTDVNVVKETQSGASINVVTESQVLGAKTELPATGANSIWLILAAIGIVSGSGLFIAGLKLRRKYA